MEDFYDRYLVDAVAAPCKYTNAYSAIGTMGSGVLRSLWPAGWKLGCGVENCAPSQWSGTLRPIRWIRPTVQYGFDEKAIAICDSTR